MNARGVPAVALSVDLDAPTDYYRFYRVPDPPPAGPFLADALARFLDLFAELGIRATFFAIGRDCADPEAARWLRRLVEAGHEVANHSFSHPIAFGRLPRSEKGREIDQGRSAIEQATGQAVVGFRCPAYDLDRELLDLLLERGALYDSSLHPSPFLLPMKWLVQLSGRRWHVGLGGLAHAVQPRRPFAIEGQGARLVELPLAVLPGLRLPFYGTMTQSLGHAFFRAGLAVLRRGSAPINYSLHAAEITPLERRGGSLARVPGYGRPIAERRRLLAATLAELVAGAESVTQAELAGREMRAIP
ncbi:MAG TPA: polysaccharide deacetylase family protein [Thermoanaerobaculia bacterium]|nr:polysaccharide deacetylase family protein [Thermoanaerobaculia bacterium]